MNAEKKTNKKTVIIAVAVLVVLVAACAIMYAVFVQKPTAGAKNITVDVVLADGAVTTFKLSTDAEYLRGALDEKKLIAGEESQYGMFIKTVNGVTADDAKQEWWCVTKGGEMVNTSVDATPIADGDKYEITLTVGYDSF